MKNKYSKKCCFCNIIVNPKEGICFNNLRFGWIVSCKKCAGEDGIVNLNIKLNKTLC